LLLHIRKPPGPKKDSILSTPQRKVGLFEKKVMKAELVLDSDSRPIAKDPRIEITTSYLKVWDNWEYGKNEPVLILNLSLRDEKYWLRDVFTELSSLSFLNITKEQLFEDHLRSFNLKICNSDRISQLKPMLGSKLNHLFTTDTTLKNIRSAMFSDSIVYRNEVTDLSLILEDGDYYTDYDFGYVHSHLVGRGSVVTEYSNFPFLFYWQPVKVFEVNDLSNRELTRGLLLNDNGVWERLLLNPYGARIANIILSEHPLQWGE
jgi:hypothetical protein